MLTKVVSYIVLVLYLGLVAYFFANDPERLKVIFNLDLLMLAGVLAVTVGSYKALSIQLVSSVKPYQIELSCSDAMKLTLFSIVLNYLPAKPGIFAKGYFLKAVYGLQIGKYIVSMLGIQILTLMTAIILGVAGCLVLVVFGLGDMYFAVVMSSAFILVFFVLLILQVIANSGFHSKIAKLDKVVSHSRCLLTEWRSDVGSFRMVVVASTVVHLLRSLRLWLIFSALGAGLALPHVVVLQSVLFAGFMFSFLPGNVGMREAIIVGYSSYLGVGVEAAFLVSVIDRVAAVILPLLIIPFIFRSMSTRALCV